MSDMPFSTQREAKQFLANKIIFEADRKGSPLTDIEKRMLLFSEQEPETVTGLPADAIENTGEEYEMKITSLLKAAYEREKDISGEGQNYKDAYAKLQEGDHYISVMAQPVLGGTRLSGSEMSLRNIFMGVAIALGIMVCATIIWVWLQSP
jgi:hypothetical protein